MTDPRPSEVQALAEKNAAWEEAPVGDWGEFVASSLHARGVRVAPSPDAPEPTTIGGVVHLHGRDVPCADEFVGECVLRAALAASGDAPREGLDVKRLYAAIVAELVVLWGEPSDAVSTQVRPIVARNIADRYVASESHPTKERTE